MWEVRSSCEIVNCTKGIMPVSMFVIYRTIFIVFGSHKWASKNSAKLDFPCCQIKRSAKKAAHQMVNGHTLQIRGIARFSKSLY